MEVSGTVLRRVPYVSAGAGTFETPYCCSSSLVNKPSSVSLGVFRGFILRQRTLAAGSEFCDDGHVKYYQKPKIRCGSGTKVVQKKTVAAMPTKKKLKLFKGLSEGLSMVSELGITLDSETSGFVDQLRGQINLDATEVILERMEQLRAQEKELKRQMKQEKANLKASKMNIKRGCESSSSSSSSESSDDECDKVVDMKKCIRQAAVAMTPESTTLDETIPIAQPTAALSLPCPLIPEEKTTQGISIEHHSRRHEAGSLYRMNGVGSVPNVSSKSKRIEVCMGNKCTKSGSAALLEEFGRAMGDDASVVGCKCMGKCKNGPNVRIVNATDGSVAEGAIDTFRTPANPLCIGVRVEDVNVILSNYFGKEQKGFVVGVAA